jgi:hypothetical protein
MPIIEVDAVSKDSGFRPCVADDHDTCWVCWSRGGSASPCWTKASSFGVERGEALGSWAQRLGQEHAAEGAERRVAARRRPVRPRMPRSPRCWNSAGWNPELDAVDNVLLIGSVMGLPLKDIGDLDEILAFAELQRLPA